MSQSANSPLVDLQLPEFQQQVLVFGDVMLDRYWQGPVRRISPEAPVPVMQVAEVEDRVGGAGNVALNLAALGCETHVFAVTGDDADQQRLVELLKAHKVQTHFQASSQVPTLKKLRILSRHQQLMRMDFEKSLQEVDQTELRASFKQQLAHAQCVVLSDYGKGTLFAVDELIAMTAEAGVPCCIDPKGTDFSRYRGATLLTPNQTEFEQVMGLSTDLGEMEDKALQMLQDLELQALLVTRGADGMLLTLAPIAGLPAQQLHIATRARDVYDVTGAGDTVIATVAAALAEGVDYAMAARLANLAAGQVVATMGTTAITATQLRRALHKLARPEPGIVSCNSLRQAVKEAKLAGRRVVMTNGCFDILHPGHMHYLQQARALGDLLIVAVNSDASVAQLKGPSRPINPLQSRMTVLAGLRAVDYVIAFDAETPEQLVADILPDVLVKGGDYLVADIAGHKQVLAAGGEVKVLDFIAGCSTSDMIDKIQQQTE